MRSQNPYSPTAAAGNSLDEPSLQPPRQSCRSYMYWTAAVSVVSSAPLASLIAVFWRFPVPFLGYVSGVSSAFIAMIGAIVYGMTGGFIIQAIMGLLAGNLAFFASRRVSFRMRWLVICFGLASALPGLLLLSFLDWMIGPW